MLLREIVSDLSVMDAEKVGSLDVEISGIAEDSRLIAPGNLFVAIPGEETDGHRFIRQALERGAAAVVGQREGIDLGGQTPYLRIADPRKDLATMAARFYGFPASRLGMIGVTGTDGKTTTTTLIHSILSAAGKKAGMVSTVGAVIDGRTVDIGVHVTTPNAVQMQAFLADMLSRGSEYAVVEATSHALSQHRVRHCYFDTAVITNVTREHLNYHRTYEEYLSAKSLLFRGLSEESSVKPGMPRTAILNKDDKSYDLLSHIPADVKYSYSLREDSRADFRAKNLRIMRDSTSFDALTPDGALQITLSLVGAHNASNALAAMAACYSLRLPVQAIIDGLSAVKSVSARMQKIERGQGFLVYVDYAHTPNAIENVLKFARTVTGGRVILVFGLSGGLRDVEKRPLMGEIAGKLSDKIVITAVDWYSQDVGDILDEIAAGCERVNRARNVDFWCVRERREGIWRGIEMAEPGDVVIVAGKGHEDSIARGGVEQAWDEVAVVKDCIDRKLKISGKVNR
ncbi:MAG: UDP-N-acetylmuramoyl-L-alanyl-D-glutamate--2,6-diaminopimelate ligase [Anaerolineales bacterium]|nr:UDP-N-acetylmuramoyl-L-alanyl-D-glutamate--2,6-diaminopimelate ligase [Anaerolineales bacterium]